MGIKKYLPDVMIFIGVSQISYGAFTIYTPAGYIVGGLLTLWIGIKAANKDAN